MRYTTIKRLAFGLVFMSVLSSSCSEDFLEPTVSVSKDVNTSVNTLEDLQSLITGALARMSTTEYYRRNYILFAEVRSGNAYSSGNSGRFIGPAQFSYNPTDGTITNMWNQIYSVIANANIVIGAEIEDNGSSETNHVRGQAYAIRALAYMDLLRVFGQQYSGGNLGVPLVLTFRDENIYPTRATVQETWDQIGQDLQTAAQLMSSGLNDASKTEVTTWMVDALQSRYYLNIKDYQNAAAAAKRVMDSGNFSILDAGSYVDSWFSDGGSNRIFELAVTPADVRSFDTLYFIYQETSYGDIEVTQDLYDLYEIGDVRKDLYFDDGTKIRMVGKYPSIDYADDIKVIRYAEVVLNYAEAMARLGNNGEALSALNSIPENRNAQTYANASIDNVLQERRKELAMEGFGFFELVRNQMDIPYVDSRQLFDPSGVPFGSYQLALPIPQQELSANPEIDQNEGY